ncbi:MAG: hypothetical protein ABSE81_04955 [Candidatus Omnitrophota bacterium]|jgi:hypothetical protein
MMETFLNIADIIIGIKSKFAPEKETASRFRYSNFILKNRPRKADIKITLKVIPKYRIFRREALFKTEMDVPKSYRLELDRLPESGRRNLSQAEERYLGSGLNWRIEKSGRKILIEGWTSGRYQLLINEDLTNGELFIINSGNDWKLTDVIYGFLQVLIIYYMAKRRIGILFHSAGVREGKNGYLFAGISRAGKSTTSRIWDKIPGIRILNDDRIIIRKDKNDLYMYPTPWHSNYSDYLAEGRVRKARLSKLFYIYHRETNLAERVNYLEGFNHFFKTLFLSFWDKGCVNFAFDFLLDILSQKPCYKFGFKNDERIVSYIRNLK